VRRTSVLGFSRSRLPHFLGGPSRNEPQRGPREKEGGDSSLHFWNAQFCAILGSFAWDRGGETVQDGAGWCRMVQVLSLFSQHHACRLRPIGVCFGNPSLEGCLGTCGADRHDSLDRVLGRSWNGPLGGHSQLPRLRVDHSHVGWPFSRLGQPLVMTKFPAHTHTTGQARPGKGQDRTGCSLAPAKPKHAFTPHSNLHRQTSTAPTTTTHGPLHSRHLSSTANAAAAAAACW
jgi:hypothetical protein